MGPGKVDGGMVTFHFRCACTDCDAEGEMTIQANETGTISCPGGCGAVYLPWRGVKRKWYLQAVVVPHYGPEAADAAR